MASEASDEIDETGIGDNLRRHFQYVERHISWKDLVIHYNLYTPSEKDVIKSKGKTDYKEATELALNIILQSNIPNRFTVLVKALEEAGFQKMVDILKGEGVPMNEFHRLIIGDCERFIQEMLNPIEILPQLVKEQVLRDSDAQVIRTRARMDGQSEANFVLLDYLPKRHPNWYTIFVKALNDYQHGDLAKIIEARAELEAQTLGISEVVPASVFFPQSPTTSTPAGAGKDLFTDCFKKFNVEVTKCKQTNCERKDFYCQKHKTRFCNTCCTSLHKECQIYDVTCFGQCDSDLHAFGIDSEDTLELCAYLRATIRWRDEYRKQLQAHANELTNDIRTERANLVEQLKSEDNYRTEEIDRLKSKACSNLDREVTLLKTELGLISHLREKRQRDLETHKPDSVDSTITLIELFVAVDRVNSTLNKLQLGGYPGIIDIQGASLRDSILALQGSNCHVNHKTANVEQFTTPKDVGFCLMPRNRVIICDREEMKLRFYEKGMLLNNKTYDLPSNPWDVGPINEQQVAVTLPESNMIQFVSVSEKPLLERNIRVPKPCWSVYCLGGQIYACCGDKGSQGKVQIFDQNGLRKRSFDNKVPNTTIETMKIFVKDKCIYATFAESNLLRIINMDSTEVLAVGHKALVRPVSLFVNSENRIFVGDVDRKKLLEFTIVDGIMVLLKTFSLTIKPQHIQHKKWDNVLLVAGAKNEV